MARTSLLAALAGAALLAGCATEDNNYYNRGYATDGWGSRPYYGAPGPYYGGYPGRVYGAYPGNYGRSDRFERTDRHVVCDNRTEVCYKRGDVDTSETKDNYGKDAARRVDRIRDRYKDDDLYLPSRKVVCARDDAVCYKNGRPDRSETRDYFGRKAARRVDD